MLCLIVIVTIKTLQQAELVAIRKELLYFEMRTLKRKTLLALSLPVDFFKKGEGFIYKPYNFLYFLLRFQPGSIRDAIGQLIKSGEVDKIIRNNILYFRLTGAGRERLLSFFPISLGQSRVWDGTWKIVIGAPRVLKLKLAGLGFKRLAKGVYMTPMPVSSQVKDCLLEKNLLGKVIVIESRRILAGDNRYLAQKLWELENLAKEYRNFISQCRRLLKRMKEQKGLKNRYKTKVVELFDEYFSLLSDDPGLPKRILVDDWPADFAREIFLKIFEN